MTTNEDSGSIELLKHVTITSKGIEFPESTDFETWQQVCRMLKSVKDSYHLALSDSIKFGTRKFGAERVQQTMVQLELPFSEFRMAGNIARIPTGLRKNAENLTSEHFYVVGKAFPDDTEMQEKWLKTASEEKLKPTELRRSVDAGYVVHDDRDRTGRGSGGIVTLQKIAFSFSIWLSQVGGEEKVMEWSREQKIAFLKETTDLSKLRDKILESLR